MNKVKLNWIHIIKDHIEKSIRLSEFHYPYAILISKFLHYFEVDIKEELAEISKPSSEINRGSLSKMRFTKISGAWVIKDGYQAGPNGTNDCDEPIVESHEPGPSDRKDDLNVSF